MATKNYSVRVGDEAVIEEIATYAEQHRIKESTAIARLLAEGRMAREGKPIVRFALFDPAAAKTFSRVLGEVRALRRVLNRSTAALSEGRPVESDKDEADWEQNVQAASAALMSVTTVMEKLRRLSGLEFLLTDVNPSNLNKWYQHAIESNQRTLVAITGALLGKPTRVPAPVKKPTEAPAPTEAKPIAS